MTPDGSLDAARAILAEAIARPVEDVPEDATLGVPPSWDSIGHMRLVLLLEERLGRMLTTDEIVGIVALADISALLQGDGGAGR